LDVIGTKILSFPPCYSRSPILPLQTDFILPPQSAIVLSQASNVYMTMYSTVSGQLFSEKLQRKTNKFSYFFHPAYSLKIFPDTNFVRSCELMHTLKEKNFFTPEVEPTPHRISRPAAPLSLWWGAYWPGCTCLSAPSRPPPSTGWL
jgi:hypothetical protein